METERRLIDANALLPEIVKAQALEPDQAVAKIIMLVTQAESVDAVEVVHGQWRVSRESEISKTVWCTACGEEFYLHKKNTVHIDKMPYCPNCGAKMDGGNEAGE